MPAVLYNLSKQTVQGIIEYLILITFHTPGDVTILPEAQGLQQRQNQNHTDDLVPNFSRSHSNAS